MPEATKAQTEVLQTVYSPLGEKFELSPANARDVLRHANFTTTKPHPDDVAAVLAGLTAESADEAEGDNADENSDENNENNTDEDGGENADENSDENSDEDSDEDNSDENADESKKLVIDFADMDKDAVRAYIDDKFPGQEIDGRWNRDKLIALALELGAAA